MIPLAIGLFVLSAILFMAFIALGVKKVKSGQLTRDARSTFHNVHHSYKVSTATMLRSVLAAPKEAIHHNFGLLVLALGVPVAAFAGVLALIIGAVLAIFT